MKKEVYLTKEGVQEIEAKLGMLRRLRQSEIIHLLKEARDSANNVLENTALLYAKQEQQAIDRKIAELESIIKNAKVITKGNTDKVTLGSKVKLAFLSDNEVETYTIVGTHEANPFHNKISHEAPIAKAILGKTVNETATVSHDLNEYQVKILGIYA